MRRRLRLVTEEEAIKAEVELQCILQYEFRASPVPPSTLEQVRMMVDEWCARKEAIRRIAEKAKIAKADPSGI